MKRLISKIKRLIPKMTIEEEFVVDEARLNSIYVRMIEILNNLRQYKSNVDELEEFLNLLLDSEVVKGNQVGRPKIDVDLIESEDGHFTGGTYAPALNRIKINSTSLYSCLWEQTLAVLINTLGHENTHYLQYHAQDEYIKYSDAKKNLDKRTRKEFDTYFEEQKKYIDNLHIKQEKITSEDFQILYRMVKDCLSEDFVRKMDAIPVDTVKKYFSDLAFSQYLNQKIEENARSGGLEFAFRKLTEIYDHPACDRDLKEYLVEQQPYILKLIDVEKKNRTRYLLFEEFEKELSSISFDQLEKIYQKYADFETYGEFLYDSYSDYLKSDEYKVTNEFKDRSRKAIDAWVRNLCANKSVEELTDLYVSTFKGGLKNVFGAVQYELMGRCTTEERKRTQDAICKALANEDCNYNVQRIYLRSFPSEKLPTLIDDLLKKDRLAFASSLHYLVQDVSPQETDTCARILNSVVQYAKKLRNRIKNNDSDIIYQDMYHILKYLTVDEFDHSPYQQLLQKYLEEHPEMKDIAKEIKEYSKEKRAHACEEDEDREYENMRRVYGEVYARSEIQADKEVSARRQIIRSIRETSNTAGTTI